MNKGHGRVEIRRLTSTTSLNAYLNWPDVSQVFRLERTRRIGESETTETVYGITSLSRSTSDAELLLALTRNHWQIENGLHWVRDVTLGEDASRVRKESGPQFLAAIRNTALHLIRGEGLKNVAAALRHYAAQPMEAINLLFGNN
jgi:predicted transposase YbfD/YdcC